MNTMCIVSTTVVDLEAKHSDIVFSLEKRQRTFHEQLPHARCQGSAETTT